jgi:hypothetical protein
MVRAWVLGVSVYEGALVKRLSLLTSLSLIAVLGLASSAFAQASFCTTSVAADGGYNVDKCVDAPSPIPTASADVTVISGGPLAPSATASGTTMSSAAAAVGGILPPTGGEGFALIAAALLLGSGFLSYTILRRSR